MKRTIKFRGYNPKNECWIYGYYFVNRGKHFIVQDGIVDPQNTWEDFEVKPESIGQFTGQFDMNGTEIYEGDIVECWDQGNKVRGEVKCFGEEESISVDVIGNIYEHSDILKEEEEQ